MAAVPVVREKETEELVENFGEVIRNAREKQGLPIKVLAEMINEKESTLVRIEKQKSSPGEKTRHKLEKELRIKLLAKATEKKRAGAAGSEEERARHPLGRGEKKEGEGRVIGGSSSARSWRRSRRA